PHHLADWRVGGPKHAVVRQFRRSADAAPREEPLSLPGGRGVGQTQARPVVPAWPLTAFPCREADPRVGGEASNELLSRLLMRAAPDAMRARQRQDVV